MVFAKSGAGKSFAIKLEALRSLMMGVECIIIDPEDEYKTLSEAVGGTYLRLSLASSTRINPFDLPRVYDKDEADNALLLLSLVPKVDLQLRQLGFKVVIRCRGSSSSVCWALGWLLGALLQLFVVELEGVDLLLQRASFHERRRRSGARKAAGGR